MSAQGVRNWPNGVRQTAYFSASTDTVSFDVEFTDTETNQNTYTWADLPHQGSGSPRVLTFDERYNRVRVTHGLIDEVFDLDPTNRASILVMEADDDFPFIQHYNSVDEWLGSMLIINQTPYRQRITLDEDPALRVEVASGDNVLWVNPLAFQLPDPKDLTDWLWPVSSQITFQEIEWLEDGEWKMWRSGFGIPPTNAGLVTQVLTYKESRFSKFRLTDRTFNLRLDDRVDRFDFRQFKWQYFAPALE